MQQSWIVAILIRDGVNRLGGSQWLCVGNWLCRVMGGLLVGRSRHVVWLWVSEHVGAWYPRGKVEVPIEFAPTAAVAE